MAIKGKNKQKQSETMGKIGAINTLLHNYPVLTTTDPMLSSISVNTSLGFLLQILEILGVTKSDIIKFICKILGGETKAGQAAGDGLLYVIEHAIKGILMINVRDILTCAINPNLPDGVMKYAHQNGRNETWNPSPIRINLNAIDIFGLLNNCPSNEDGSIFYFDAYESNYAPNDLYKSQDFNAFLWYIVNKGDITNPINTLKNTWDNRIKASKQYANDITLKNNFFAPNVIPKTEVSGPNITITGTGSNTTQKKQFIILDYQDTDGGVIDVYLNADRYYLTRQVGKPTIVIKNKNKGERDRIKLKLTGNKNSSGYYEWYNKKDNFYCYTKKETPGIDDLVYDSNSAQITGYTVTKYNDKIQMNRTIFEFNYDYIYSLKLFDTKTLLANIVNSLLGLSCSVNINYTYEQQIIKEKIGEIVRKVMQADDSDVSDCFFSFSNDEYNSLLEKTTEKYTGKYTGPEPYNPAYAGVMDSLRNINSPASKNKNQRDIIGGLIEEISDNTQINMDINNNHNFKFDHSFINEFLQQTVTEIILQVLSPKVAILYAVNSAINGQVDKIEGMENLMKDIQNVILSIIKEVKNIIIKELYNFMMEKLAPILKLFISKLALETIKAYKDLILGLILNCIPNISFKFNTMGTIIDNVDYADIVPKKERPDDTNC